MKFIQLRNVNVDRAVNEATNANPNTVIIEFITLLSDIAFYHGIK